MNDEHHRRLQHQLYLARENPEPTYDVSNCDLSTIPQGCFSLCKVLRKKKLFLNKNHIKQLNSNGNKIEDLTVLTELYLEFNEITTLPEEICRIQYLQILNVSDNKLHSLPSSIGNLLYLRELYVQNNLISTLPTSLLNQNSNLEIIDVSGNPSFSIIPIEIINLNKLRRFSCTTKYLRVPSQGICEKGIVSIVKAMCESRGIQVNQSFFERISNWEDVNSSTVDSSILDYEKSKEDRLNFLKTIQDEYNQTILSQKSFADKMSNDRIEFIRKLSEEEAKITNEIAKMQIDRDLRRQQLIEDIKAAENDAAHLIEEIITMSKTCQRQEKILDEIESENMKIYQLYNVSKVECEQLRRKEILNAMSQMLNLQDSAKGNLKSDLSTLNSATNKTVSEILKEKLSKQNEFLSEIEHKENKQKMAFQCLQLQKDIRTLRLTEYIYSIESELILLSQAEQRKRAQEVEFKYNVLNEKRQQLVEMLENLTKQKEIRERVLYQRMMEVAKQRQKDQDDFWLVQYQRCLDMKPHCFWDTNNGLDSRLMDLLIRVNAREYLPFLLRFKVTWDQVKDFQEQNWQELGIYNAALLKKLQAAVKEMKIEEKKSKTKSLKKENVETIKNTNYKPTNSMFVTCQRETECCICLNDETNILFMTCGHICCCENCSKNLEECPLCRSAITRIIKLMCW